jgi:hypothetical protein
MTTDKLNSIIDKIRKLLALANDGRGNEAEMSNAAALAEKMMTEYNLSVATIEAAGGATDEGREQVRRDEVRVDRWRQELMKTTAEINFCHIRGYDKWDGRKFKFAGFQIIGRKSNVAAAQVLFDYLAGAVDRLAKNETGGDHRQLFSRAITSFRKGVSDRLIVRLEEKREKDIAEARAKKAAAQTQAQSNGTANAMVVVLSDFVQDEQDLNDDFVMGYAPGTTKANRAKREAQWKAERAARKAKEASLIAQGIPANVAYHMAFGATYEEAMKQAKPETASERAKREQSNAKWQDREYRRRAREAAKYDVGAYLKGQKAGDSISLVQQMNQKSAAKIG